MNQKHARRLERLESAALQEFKGIAFFQFRNGVYRDTQTGEIFQPQEFVELMARYPECAFLPCMDPEDTLPEFTRAELEAINNAIRLARSEGRPYDAASDPDPAVRATEARLDAHFRELWRREMRGWEFMEEQLLRMGRADVVALRQESRAARAGDFQEAWTASEDP